MIVMDHHDVAAAATTVVAATAVVAAAVEAAVEAATCSIAIPRNRPLPRASTASACSRAAKVLVAAAPRLAGTHGQALNSGCPGLLWCRPTPLRVRQPSMAVVRQLGVHSSGGMHRLPGPIAVHLHAHAHPPIPTQPTCTCFHIMP